jgi:hypothetical protein
MSGGEQRRSAELEKVRLMLFPNLSPEEGWRRIDAALERGSDTKRADRVEDLAEDPELDEELLRALAKLRRDEPS